jgi:peptidyl-dipeptidase A
MISMLKLGQSRPWPDALEAISGERQMDATAIIDYYAPLMEWLAKENKGQECGW